MTNKETKQHRMLTNLFYALGNMWKWDRRFFAFLIPLIPISIILSVLDVYFPKVLIDALENQAGILYVVVIILIYFAFVFSMTVIRMLCNSRISARKYSFAYGYQNLLWEKYMTTDFPNTDSIEPNIMFQNAMNDAKANCSAETVWQSLIDIANSVLGLLTFGTIITTVSPWIILLLLLSAAVTYAIGRWIRNYTEKNKDIISALDRKITYLYNLASNFDYAKDIRLFSLSDWISEMFSGFLGEKRRWHRKVENRSLAGAAGNALLALIRDGAAYGVLTYLLFADKISTGDFVFLFGAITSFSSWLNGISNKVNELAGKCVKIGYYRDYLGITEVFNHGKGCDLPSQSELPIAINLKSVSYRYQSAEDEKCAVRDIDLSIAPGEKIAIVGANGAGKTTLVKLICGLYYPTSGEILVNGKDVKTYNIEQYYSMFSVVFQDIHVLPITLEEFIASSDKTIDKERVRHAVNQAGLRDKIDSLPNGIKTHLVKGVFDDSTDLSGGEKQKLMLARAIYKDGPVLILDEPTSALDPIAENDVYLMYNKMAGGKTSIFISHRLASTRFCDRILFMENGEIVEEGSHSELLAQKGKYYSMFELQSQYYKENGVT